MKTENLKMKKDDILIASWFPGFLIIIFLFFIMHGQFIMNGVSRCALPISQLLFSLPDVLVRN